jgi:adenine phosphoribosyltransferase
MTQFPSVSPVDLRAHIRDIPDFPKKGIVFKDITPLLGDGPAFSQSIEWMADVGARHEVDKVIAIESRGFIFGSAVAHRLGVGVVPVRKKGRLPYKTISATYALEYGEDTLEMHVDAIKPNERVLVVDDVLATGGTAAAVARLVTEAGGHVLAAAFAIELNFLKGRERLTGFEVASLIRYD